VKLAVVSLLMVACSAGSNERPSTEGASGSGTTQPSRVPGMVTRADFGKDWPLTVDAGVLSCEGASAVYFTANGIRYAVNGSARTRKDAPDIDPIWAKDPRGYSPKKDIGPLIDRGLQLCE
jgi:hypothetical protein